MSVAPFGTCALPALPRAVMALTRLLPANWLGRRLALWLRKPVLLWLGARPADVEVLGFKMRVQPQDNVSEKRVLFTPQFFDADELALLAQRACPGYSLIDIGANAGLYSLFLAARCGGQGKILAVEPQPEMLARLRTNIALNGFSDITVCPLALSDRAGEITFHLGTDNRGGAGLHSTGTALRVPTLPLLDLLDAHGITQPDAVKIDIEGAEALVLGAFFAHAPRGRWPKLVFIERNNAKWKQDITAHLRTLGYCDRAGGRMNAILELAP